MGFMPRQQPTRSSIRGILTFTVSSACCRNSSQPTLLDCDVEEHEGKGTAYRDVSSYRNGGRSLTLKQLGPCGQLLRLNPDAKDFKLNFGALPQDDKEIAMLTRSMLEILMEATAGVEIPDSDIQGRARIQDGRGRTVDRSNAHLQGPSAIINRKTARQMMRSWPFDIATNGSGSMTVTWLPSGASVF